MDFGILPNVVSGGITAGISSAFGKHLADYNAQLNYKYNEMAAKNADARTRALYEDFMSPASRIAQLKAAGLSPSLYADGAGAGSQGVTAGAQGAGSSGVGVPTNVMPAMDAAQIRLANAQAEKAEAEAATERGDNERGASDIAKNWADAGAASASAELKTAQTTAQELDNYIKDATKDYSVWEIKNLAQKSADEATRAYFEAQREGLAFNKDLATFENEIEVWAKRAEDLAADIALKKSQTQLNDAEKNAISSYVKIGLMNALTNAANAKAYSDYVESYADNLPKQLELKGKEINLEKWRIGLQPVVELIKTAGYIAGASQLGDGGYQSTENTKTFDKNGKQIGSQTKNVSRTKLPKVR